MCNRISSSIVGKVLIAGWATVLMATTAAHADGITVQQRAEKEMNTGKDYTAAWAAAMRVAAPAYSESQIARARKAERAMNEGKDYHSAWNTTSPANDSAFSPEQIAKARRAQEEMLSGKDYLAAWQTAENVQRTRAPAVRQGSTVAAGGDGNSTMK